MWVTMVRSTTSHGSVLTGALAAQDLEDQELGRSQSGSNQLVLTKGEQERRKQLARQEAAAEEAADAAEAMSRTPQSKAQRRKLEQIASRKRKADERVAVLATLSTHRVDAAERGLLRTSGTMGEAAESRGRHRKNKLPFNISSIRVACPMSFGRPPPFDAALPNPNAVGRRGGAGRRSTRAPASHPAHTLLTTCAHPVHTLRTTRAHPAHPLHALPPPGALFLPPPSQASS